MDHNVLSEWVATDPKRASWLAKKIGVSYEFVRLMAKGKKPIPIRRIAAIKAAMRLRARAEKLLNREP